MFRRDGFVQYLQMPLVNLGSHSILMGWMEIEHMFVIVKLLALALTNLVLSLVNLVTNLAKRSLGQPSHKPDQT